jgi:hypothetical protein
LVASGEKPWEEAQVSAAVRDVWPTDQAFPILTVNLIEAPPLQLDSWRMHLGTHPGMFSWFGAMPEFARALHLVQTTLYDRRPAGGAIVVVALDRNGRHASAAFAKLLAECVLFDPSVSLGTITFLDEIMKETSCGVCNRCEFWSRKWRMRNDTMGAAIQVWRQNIP